MATNFINTTKPTGGASTVYVSKPYGPEQLQSLAELLEKKQTGIVEALKIKRARIRQEVLTDMEKFFSNPSCPPGPYSLSVSSIEVANSLFEGGRVEGVDGSMVSVPIASDSMSLISAAAVNHLGRSRGVKTQVHTLGSESYDLVSDTKLPIAEVLSRGAEISRSNYERWDMAARQQMVLSERLLMDSSTSSFVLGHGNPLGVDLFSKASGDPSVVELACKVTRSIVEKGNFGFVPSEAPSMSVFLDVANALDPYQFCIFDDVKHGFDVLRNGVYSGALWGPVGGMIDDLAHDIEDVIVVCGYKCSSKGPGRLFFAHKDSVFEIASIVLADSQSTGPRNFPSIIDLADRVAGRFPSSFLRTQANINYAKLGVPFEFREERSTRR